jgi:hypothetical protein
MSHFVLPPQGETLPEAGVRWQIDGRERDPKHAVFSALLFILKNNQSAQNASHDFRPA